LDDDLNLKIKRLVLVALFSDSGLMNKIVLKGGNVLDLVYNVAFRSSVDIDFSIEGEFKNDELGIIECKIRNALKNTFNESGYIVFDVKLIERPKTVSPDMKDFWGGYRVNFKVIDKSEYNKLKGCPKRIRTRSFTLGPGQKKAFRIDISKYEFCKPKRAMEIDGSTVYVYTPEMMVFEKLRAICQQMPEYKQEVNNPSQSARARDFFDIYTILENFKINISSPKNVKLLNNIFLAKRVPLKLIGLISKYRDYHKNDFVSVVDTVFSGVDLKDFDFYFDYVVQHCCDMLKPFWEI